MYSYCIMVKYNKKKKTVKRKTYIANNVCDDKMTFQDCELAVLRHAVDLNEDIKGRRVVGNSDVKDILKIVEQFIVNKKLICYGGTAINNILPKSVQFYNKDVEIPDYDFFSPNAMEDSKELADIYYKAGYIDVEAKAGMHYGTYKVFVNFIPIADITQLVKPLYNSIYKEAIKVGGIHYTPPNYLRMSMYLELSRPDGDSSRWEKVLKRLNLLNKYRPMTTPNCEKIDFQRRMDTKSNEEEKLYVITRDTLIGEDVVFFGGYASGMYSKYMDDKKKRKLQKIPDFDVLSDDPDYTALRLKEQLEESNFKDVRLVHNNAVGEVVPENIEVTIGKNEIIAIIHKPIGCHSYNEVFIDNNKIKIATIDTIMSLYLSFIYIDKETHNDRLVCMAKYLFDLQEEHRLTQGGLLKRFTNTCYGKQKTLEDIRSEKANKYKELGSNRTSKEYEEWFLKYTPREPVGNTSKSKLKSNTTKKKTSVLSKVKRTKLLKFFGLTD